MELKLLRQIIQSVFRVAHEMERVVFSTQFALNTFFPNNNNTSQSCPTVQLAVTLCACTGLLVQHSLTVITITAALQSVLLVLTKC